MQNQFSRLPLSGDAFLSVASALGTAIPLFRPGFGSIVPGMFQLGELKVRFANLGHIEDVLSIVMSSEVADFESAGALSSLLANRLPNLLNSMLAAINGVSRTTGFTRIATDAWSTPTNNMLALLLRNDTYRIGLSPSALGDERSFRQGPADSPPVTPQIDEFLPVDPAPLLLESENISPIRFAARIVNVLGQGSILSPRAVELVLRKVGEDVYLPDLTISNNDFENEYLPWIAAVTLAALACECGRRQVRRYRLRAERDDARNELRDLLFLNLGHEHD
jgi:hypothetical protein